MSVVKKANEYSGLCAFGQKRETLKIREQNGRRAGIFRLTGLEKPFPGHPRYNPQPVTAIT